MSDRKYIIILCLGRSGSTLLTQLVNQQVGETMTNEPGGGSHFSTGDLFLKTLADLCKHKTTLEKWNQDMRTRIGKFSPNNPHYVYNYQEYNQEYYNNFLQKLLQQSFKCDKQITGFKTIFEPSLSLDKEHTYSYWNIINHIVNTIPNIYFICLTRDNEKIFQSRERLNWKISLDQIKLSQGRLVSLSELPRVFHIKYEDLTEETSSFRDIISKIGVEYSHEKYITTLKKRFSY